MSPVNLSFAACGFLGIYQLGAAGAVLRHGGRLLRALGPVRAPRQGPGRPPRLLTAPGQVGDFTYRFASEVRSQKLGPLTPGYDFMLALRSGMEDILPGDAHTLAGDRLK
ncbi:hypothetical protein CRUP_014638 [Coryphaenoides rupestris]|nr:hypothetical protein CRUP_014638 [Coryphaenoides rupestris]